MQNHSAAEVKARLLQNLEATLRMLFPNGVIHGHEFCIGSPTGEAGTSLKIELRGSKAGVWNDFSDPSNKTSGDIIELWCAARGETFKEAFPEMSRWAGFNYIERPRSERKPKPAPYSKDDMASLSGTPALEYLHERGLSDETLKRYRVRGHRRQSDFNEHFIAFQYIDTEGSPVMLKSLGLKLKTVQTKDRVKNVKDIWTSEPYYTLWGWWTVPPDCREIMIIEGEIDTMSVFQLNPGMPVLSMPSGTSNMDWIENDWDRLQLMENIWVCSDCDGLNRQGKRPGEEGAKVIASRLGQTRVARVPLPAAFDHQLEALQKIGVVHEHTDGRWRFKDANAALLHGEPEQLEVYRWFEEAYYFEPKTIRPAREFASSSFAYLKRRKRVEEQNDFIWPNVRFQYRPGELTIISGYPFGGKSTFINQSHLHEAFKGEKILYASYEMHPDQTESELAIMLWGKMPDDEAEYMKAMEWLDGKWWFIRTHEKYSLDDLIEDIHYAAQRYGITRVVIDSLFFIARKEDYEAQDTVVRRLKNFTEEHPQVHVSLVAHSIVKRDMKMIPGMSEVEGSGGLVKPIDNGITIHRNANKSEALKKADEDEDEKAREVAERLHDGTLYVWKQRLTGVVIHQKLYFLSDAKSFKTRKGDDLLPILAQPEPDPNEQLF